MQQNHSNREVYSNTILPQEISISNKNPNLTWEATRERRANPRVSRRKEILKIRAEINAKERDHSKNQQSQKLVL